MNILSTIMNKIFHPHAQAGTPQPQSRPSPLLPEEANKNAAANQVDIEEVMRAMEARTSQHLDWRHSIVDLMKLLGLDSDLASRKQLAKELNYTGDMNDSAKMNIWLHQEVLRKLEENGGKIPESMKH